MIGLVWQGWVLVGVAGLIVWLLVGLVVAVAFGRAIRGRPRP